MKLCQLMSTNALHESHSQSSSQGTLAQVETDGVKMFYLFTWRLPAFLTTSQRHSAIQARLQVVSPVPSPAVWEQDYVAKQGTPLLKNRCLP